MDEESPKSNQQSHEAATGAAMARDLSDQAPMVTAPPVQKGEEHTRREKAALQKLDVARSLAASSNRIFLIFSLSLGLSWFQTVLPRVKNIARVSPIANLFLPRSESVVNSPRLKNLSERRLRSLRVALKEDHVSERQGDTISFARKSNADDDERAEFTLPFGFGKLPVASYFAPLLWALLCLSLGLYLDFNRRRCFALLGRSLRILQDDLHYSSDSLVDIFPGLPWWFVPLPASGTVVTAEKLRDALGWSVNLAWRENAGKTVLGFLALLQFLTLVISCVTLLLFANRNPLEQFLLLCATAMVGCATLLCIADWVHRRNVPDNRVLERNPADWGRREALRSAAYTLAAVLLVPPSNLLRSFWRNEPRFARKKAPRNEALAGPPATGAFLNTKSGVVHYVSAATGSRQPSLRGASQEFSKRYYATDLLSAVSSSIAFRDRKGKKRRAQVHIDRRHEAWAIEQEAEQLVCQDTSGPQKACELLRHGIELAPRDLRLYDRLAVITVQHNLAEERRLLAHMVKTKLDDMRRSQVPDLAKEAGGRSVAESLAAFRRKAGGQTGRPNQKGGLWSGLGERAFFGRPPQVGRRKHMRGWFRRKCKNGTLVARTQNTARITHLGHHRSLDVALASRLAAWQNEESKWFKKWQAGRVWKQPQPCNKCSKA